MNPQFMESTYPYGGGAQMYNQMTGQQPDQPGQHPPHFNQPPPQQFAPSQNAYPPQFNPNVNKSDFPPPNAAPRHPPPQQGFGNLNYQNGATSPPPSSFPPSQANLQRMPPPGQLPNFSNSGLPPHSNQQSPGMPPPPRPMGNANIPQQLVNKMANVQLNNSAGPPSARPPFTNGSGTSFPPHLPPPSSLPMNLSGPPNQSFVSNQGVPKPPLPGQTPTPASAAQQPPLPGQQAPPQNNLQQSQPPIMGQQPPMPRQQLSPAYGHQPSTLPGQVPPPMTGQQPPSTLGHQLPPTMGQQAPLMSNQQSPPMMGQQPSSMGGPPPGFPNVQTFQQTQDFGHRLPLNQAPLPGGVLPPSMGQQQFMNSPNYSQPGFTQSSINSSSNMDSINGNHLAPGAMPPYSGPPTSHQFNIGATPPPPGSMPSMQPPQPNQYGAVQQKYPLAPGTQPPAPNYMASNQAYNQMHQGPGAGHLPPQPPPQQQQQRRLDPEMMPSPIQVIEDDRKTREGDFCTNLRGQVPPLVTTKFITRDQGNCNPRYTRSTMYTVPCNPDMIKQAMIPFVLSISPFAKLAKGEVPPPVVQPCESGPTRCIRCKAYMCPYMQFIDGGRRFQCSFCRATTEVPPDYFAHLDHTGQRVDKYERPELCLGSYEFIATKDYCKNNVFPLPPAFIFIIDVSYNNIKNGVVQLLCQNMKTILAHLPREHPSVDSQVKVGFITYSSTVQFYNLKSCLSQPQVLVVPDVQDMFMPLLDGFLVGVDEAALLIDSLMEQIPTMYADNRETETILGPVIKAGMEALKAADRSGKLFVFNSSLPIAEAPGKLKNRDDRKLLGTDKEKTILAPQIPFYSQLGQECVAAGCSVDLFTFPNAYIDIATIGQVSRLSGGQIHKYSYFVAEVDGERFIKDLCISVGSQEAFDCIMRVRTSTGVRPVEFYGNYYMSNTTDVELAAADSDKAICVEIKHDDKLTDEEAVYIQTAILYTSVGGQRRLRIHNLSLNTCTQMADLYKNCELDTLMNFYSKHCLRQLCDQSPKQVKENIINKCAQGLACYRKNCASPSSAGQLILPECMKLLPLYVNCLLKNDAIAGGSDMNTDDRSYAMHFLNSMDVSSSLGFIYPRLIPLHDLDYNSLSFPNALRCSAEKLKDNGIYLLENGMFIFMWVGINADTKWLQNVFGVQSAAQLDIDKVVLLELDNPISQGVRQIINEIREERRKHVKLVIVHQKAKLEVVFKHFLVEDKGMDGSPSYVDFLCHVHKEIRNLLS